MTRARPGSKWSMDGQVHALAGVPAGGKCSGMICACMSTIIYWLLFERRLCRRKRTLCTVASRDGWGESGGSGAAPPDIQSLEQQDSPSDFARLHRPKRFVDVVEPAAARDHLVEQEAPLAIELEVAGDIDAETVRAHPRGLHPALRANRHPRELDLRVRRQNTDDGGGAPDGQALDGLAHEGCVPDGLEGVIHAGPARESADRLDRIVLRAVDDVGRADAPGHLQLRLEDIDADDLTGAADARPLDDRQPHAAAAEHGDGLPGPESGRSQRGPHAGANAAPDEGGSVERKLGVDLHHRVLVQQHALGVARDADELSERLALLRKSRRGRPRPGDDAADAEVRVPAEALLAAPAEAGH